MFLRDIVGKWFIEYRTDLFNMEVGRLAYDLLNTNPDMQITDKAKDMNNMQILVLLRCIVSKLDYTLLVAKDFNHKQMEELRQYLLRGMNITLIYDTDISHETMRLVRNTISKGVNVPHIHFADYTSEQVEQLMLALTQGLDIEPLLDNKLSEDEMEIIRRKMNEERMSDIKILDEKYYADIHKTIFGE